MKTRSKKSKLTKKLKNLVPDTKKSIYHNNNNYIVSDTFGSSTPASPMARLDLNPDNRSSVSYFNSFIYYDKIIMNH